MCCCRNHTVIKASSWKTRPAHSYDALQRIFPRAGPPYRLIYAYCQLNIEKKITDGPAAAVRQMVSTNEAVRLSARYSAGGCFQTWPGCESKSVGNRLVIADQGLSRCLVQAIDGLGKRRDDAYVSLRRLSMILD